MTKKPLKLFLNGLLFVTCLAVMALIGVYILNLNRFSGLTGDDFLYHFIYTGEWPAKGGPQVYHNLWDWVVAIYNHMTLWNARLTSIIFEIAAMQVPKTAFNLINTTAYLLVGLEINLLATGKHALRQPLQLLLTYLLMWFFLSGFGSTVLWVSGAANYLWPTVIILAFFMPYRFNYHVQRHPKLMTWAMLILGILAGMSNEVGSSTAILVVACFTFFARPKGAFNDFWWKIVGVVANLIGFLTMLALSSNSSESQTYGVKDGLVYHLKNIFGMTLTNSGVLLLLILIVSLIVLFNQPDFFRDVFEKRPLTPTEMATLSGFIFLISALAGIAATVISPVLFPRLWFAVNILLIVSLLNLLAAYQGVHKDSFFAYTILTLLTTALLFLAIPSYQLHLKDIKPFYNVFYTHQKLATTAHQRGQKIVRVPGIPVTDDLYNPYKGTPYVMPGNPKKQWSNTWMAHFWGVEEIRLDNEVPVQVSPQKNLAPIDSIQNWSQTRFGQIHFLKKLHLPNVTAQPNFVQSIKNDPTRKPVDELQLDNRDLPADKPWLRHALIRYLDVTTNQIVGIEKLTSPYDEDYDISHASLAGYQTLTNNPQTYHFTQSYQQYLIIKVKPPRLHLNVYYDRVGYDRHRLKETRIATIKLTGNAGQLATLSAPSGYTFNDGRTMKQLKISQANSERGIALTRLPLNQRLKNYRNYYWLATALVIWFFLDILFAVIERKIESHQHRKQREQDNHPSMQP